MCETGTAGIGESTEALTGLLGWLADVYWFPPSVETIASFEDRGMKAAGLFRDAGDGGGWKDAVSSLLALAGKADEPLRREVALDYTALFCGTDRNGAFPYESCYRGERHELMQKPASEVRAAYRHAGFPERQSDGEPPDHISNELDFLAFGIAGEGRVSQEELRRFCAEHVTSWVPDFCTDVELRAQTEFFRRVAVITKLAVLRAQRA